MPEPTHIHAPSQSADRHSAAIARHKESLADWQKNRMPFIQWFLALMAVAVFASAVPIYAGIFPLITEGSSEINDYANAHIETLVPEDGYYIGGQAQNAAVAYRTARRHDRAGAAVLLGGWLRFAGFMVGSALVFSGALFVIGKFAETSPIALSAENASLKASLTTASPGLYAMTLGAAIVIAAIAIRHEVKVTDERLSTTPGAAQDDAAEPDGPQTQAGLSAGEIEFTCGETGLNPDHPDCP